MRIQALQHVAFEGPGCIASWARCAGHPMRQTRLFAGERLPALDQFDWLVVLGGPMNVYEDSAYPWLTAERKLIGQAIAGGKVVLGVCLGAQLIAAALGARVRPNAVAEIGWFPVKRIGAEDGSSVVRVLPEQFDAFHWHGDTFDLPTGAVRVASTSVCENQAFLFGERVVGLQFHLETTPAGAHRLIEHCAGDLVPAPFVRSEQSMLEDPARFRRAHALMARLLDALSRLGPPG